MPEEEIRVPSDKGLIKMSLSHWEAGTQAQLEDCDVPTSATSRGAGPRLLEGGRRSCPAAGKRPKE